MAAPKTRKVSRRQLIRILSTSAVAGAMGDVLLAEAQAPKIPIVHCDIKKKAAVKPGVYTDDQGKPQHLVSCAPCCPVAQRVVTNGVASLLDQTEKAHIQPIIDAITDKNNLPLLEYCYIAFGVTSSHIAAFDAVLLRRQ
jgi:hypothetical protein